MVIEAGSVLFGIKQKGTAASKSYRFVLGFRPISVHVYKVVGSSPYDLEEAFSYDGTPTHGATGGDNAYRGGKRSSGATNAHKYSGMGSAGIQIFEDGFQIGTDAFFRVNDAVLWFQVHRGANYGIVLDLDDVTAYAGAFGTGGAYKTTPQHTEGTNVGGVGERAVPDPVTGNVTISGVNVPSQDISVFEV